jgi:hypothetical protein
MMKNKFCQDINMKKMTGFLDEKYTPGIYEKYARWRDQFFGKIC